MLAVSEGAITACAAQRAGAALKLLAIDRVRFAGGPILQFVEMKNGSEEPFFVFR
jgi:hypothetical protein